MPDVASSQSLPAFKVELQFISLVRIRLALSENWDSVWQEMPEQISNDDILSAMICLSK